MEETTKDTGHRPSVSMPSLDATDDFSATASTEVSQSGFVTINSTFVSTASTESIVSFSGHTDASSTELGFTTTQTISVGGEQSENSKPLVDESSSEQLSNENNTPNDSTSTDPLIDGTSGEGLIDETSTEPSIEGTSAERLTEEGSSDSLINAEASAQQLLDEVSAEHLIGEEATEVDGDSVQAFIDEASTEPLLEGAEVLNAEDALDDSQGEEDPSIAIDQFIKKIADEQLSSKRIEERKEEEAKEQKQDTDSNNLDGMSQNLDELEQSTSEKTEEHKEVLETPSDQSSKDKVEPMDIKSEIHTAPTQNFNMLPEKTFNNVIEDEDHMQMESIEEIQKEIDRIPPKKIVKKDEILKKQESNSQNGSTETNTKQTETHTQESIEQILGEDITSNKTAVQQDNPKSVKTKEPTIEDSNDVAKDSILIEKAQEELNKLDVLVCGECHHTFYYIEDFSDHKKGKCTKQSILTVLCENESRHQVWGYILWKIKQTKDMADNIPSSWYFYQKWCKLPQVDKNAWITAGQMIQYANRISHAEISEVKPVRQAKQVVVHKVIDKDQSAPSIEYVDSNKENSSNMDLDNSTSNILKKGINKPVKLNDDVTILPSTKNASSTNIVEPSNTNKAIRTTKVLSTQKEEYVVEKIMAKRFNPRRKTWEYNIKWENFGHESNTWEPVSNLSHCKNMLDQFEEQLKRMKEEKLKQAAQSPKGRGRPSNTKPTKPNSTNFVPIAPKTEITPRISNVVGGVGDDYAGGSSSSSSRPTRTCKQKALNQVKQWCGNISDEDSGGGLKRRHDSDDSDEDFDEKRIKMEDDSDFSDKESKPKISIKKVTSTPKQTVKNGNTGPQQILPSNILIPDANGVVRINQKQLPSLSSGVYIMSKTAGIIKLDSTTSKVATSGGQTIVKVAPKIGQTQIKIVKKDGNTTKQIIQVSPKPLVSSTPVKVNSAKSSLPKIAPKIRKEIKKAPSISESSPKALPPKKPEAPSSVASSTNEEEESDDGLEPLPFPAPDDPLPDLEDTQNNDEFVLDPTTGKIAGVEYEDKPVVIKEEPQPVKTSTSDLENIVKLAAAEITESDSQDDTQMELEPLFTETKDIKPVTVQHSSGGTPVVRKVVKYVSQGIKTEGSILNKALTHANSNVHVQQRPRVVQQKVINQMVSRTPVSSGQTRTVVRHVIGPQRPSAGGNLNVVRKTVAQSPKSRFNLSPQKPHPSPLQPTRTYSAMGGVRQPVGGQGSKVQVYSTKSTAGSQMGQQQVVRRVGNTIVRSSSGGHVNTVQRQHTTQYGGQKPVTRIVQRVVTSPKRPENHNVISRSVSQPHQRVVANQKPKTVISMPILTDDDAPIAPAPKIVQKPQPQVQKSVPQLAAKQPIKTEPAVQLDEPVQEEIPAQPEVAEAETNGEQATDWSSFTMADGDNPIYVTGDDGTIYQVAGQNEQGQTILITQGPDGQQQCLLVTNEIGEMLPDTNTDAPDINEKDAETPVEEPAAALVEADPLATSVVDSIQTPLQIQTDPTEMEGVEEGMQDQVVAQVVRAEPPSPGGTHKVVVMLPDGNLMVTQVSPEEYASLELE